MQIHALLATSLAFIPLLACTKQVPREHAEASQPQDEERGAEREENRHRFRHAAVRLPPSFTVTIDESGLTAAHEVDSRCGPTTVELSYFGTHRSARKVKEEGERCKTRRYVKTLPVPGEKYVRARLVCEARGEFDDPAIRTICDDIVESLSMHEDSNAAEIEGLDAPVVRERITPELSNEYGEHELYVPGRGVWRPIHHAGSFRLDGKRDALLIGLDFGATGTALKVLYRSDDGQYGEAELDYIDGRLWAAEVDEATAKPVDLFGELREDQAGRSSKRCVRYIWTGSGYRASQRPCATPERRGRIVFSN